MTLKRASPGPSGLDQPVRKKTLAKDPWGRPRFQGCETIKAYEMLGKLGEGTFGFVAVSERLAVRILMLC